MTTTQTAADAAARSDSFAAQLNRLFSSIYPPGRGPYTSQELVRWLGMRGLALSAPYLSQLRTGERKRPSEQTVEMIAEIRRMLEEWLKAGGDAPPGDHGRTLH